MLSVVQPQWQLLLASQAIAFAAEQLRRDVTVGPMLEVSYHCSARHAALQVLLSMPKEMTVAEVVAALEQAPPFIATLASA